MTDQTTDFFDNAGGGAGAPTAALKNVNDSVTGEIVEMFKRDYVPFGKTEPEKDENEADGKRKQLVIIVQTALRNWQGVSRVPKVDPADQNSAEKSPSEDDGKRAIYVPNRSNLQYAIGKAVSAAGAAAGQQVKFSVGGTLGVRIFNLKDTGKGNPLKEHEARYSPPAAGSDFFQGQQAPAQSAPAQQGAPLAQGSSFGGGDHGLNAPAPAPSTPAPSQDPWATPSTPAPQATPAPSQDPWATPAAGQQEQPPF